MRTNVTSTFKKIFILSSLSGVSYFLGRKSKEDCINNSQHNDLYNKFKKPGLPIFATVSAAVPMVSSPNQPSVITSTESRIAQIMRFGFPGLDNIRSFDDFVLSYDKKTRTAHWVFEHLTAEHVKQNKEVDRSKCDFKADDSVHPYFRSENSDYKKSGYDRGHLAAAGNHKRNQKHVDQTFYLSNISPQVGVGFNRDSWNRLESYSRKLTRSFANVYICTGPLYLPRKEANGKLYVKYEVIGSNHVAVPTHFFKVIVCETHDGKLEMESFVMANEKISDEIPIENFRVPPDTIERAAGLLFFDKINRKMLTKINGKKT